MPYRVLILDTEFEMGGKEKKLFDFIRRTDRSRFEISVCCLKQAGYFRSKLEALGVRVYEGMLHHRFDALAFRGLEQVLRAERTQLVYTFAHPVTVIFAYLAKLRRLTERAVVSYHATGNPEDGRQVPVYLLPLLRRMDLILAVAESHKEYLVRVEGLPRDRIRVIHNGVDTEAYRPARGTERTEIRSALGLADDAIVFMAVSSLKPLKRLDLLLNAAAPTLRRENARLVIVGRGPERDRLTRLAEESRIADRVVFTGMRDDVDTMLRAADVLVLSSRTEAFPNVVLEAMATGLPVVTTDVGSVREMAVHEASALIVPPEDESALGAAIERIAGDAALRGRLGARGREIVEARFRIEAMCAAREALFVELLSPGASARDLAAGAKRA
jgi:glycosyltransferase involved in cell wall biosynthesis